MKNNIFSAVLKVSLILLAGCSPLGAISSVPLNKKAFHADPLLYSFMQGYPLPEPAFELSDEKYNKLIDYERFGTFENVGTEKFKYKISDRSGLKSALPPGFYPNLDAMQDDPIYRRLKEQAMLDVNYWDVLESDDWRRAYYVWTQAPIDNPTKAYFMSYCLERAGHIQAAINAYYNVMVQFPRGYCWGKGKGFVWYLAQAAMDNIVRLTRDYPQLELDLEGATFEVQNGYDANPKDDMISVNPGRLVKRTLTERLAALPDLKPLKIKAQRGRGRVRLVQFENGHWQMLVDNKPFFVRGISYNPTKVGMGPQSDLNFMQRWMFSDENNNGKIDAPYDAWVDQNRNDVQDSDEPAVGDFQLLKDMGVNAIRVYPENRPKHVYDPSLINKPLLRQMYAQYGITVMVGDYLGAYTVGNQADWERGTDYRDPEQCAMMKAAVRDKVMDLKDEPFVLCWILGNENNMAADYMGLNATRTNSAVYPQAYAEFLNEVAAMIHKIDGNHPVVIGNIEMGLADYYDKFAPELDILGANSYRGTVGFGNLWEAARSMFDRPVIITEYGCDAYYEGRGLDEEGQARFLEGKFRDIVLNAAGGPGEGNALGGVIFEYLDEWWKDTFGHPEDAHQEASQFPLDFPDGLSHEEWFGIVGQGDGQQSPFKRQLRQAYRYFVGVAGRSPVQDE